MTAADYCANNFDSLIDQAPGRYNLYDPEIDLRYILSLIAPGIAMDPNEYEVFENFTEVTDPILRRELVKRHLEKRGLRIFKAFGKAVASVCLKVAKGVSNLAGGVIKNLKRALTNAWNVASKIVKAALEFTFHVSFSQASHCHRSQKAVYTINW